jgi:hypothetical protein
MNEEVTERSTKATTTTHQMLSGVDLRVRRMETRASTLATFRESSDCALNTDWPAKVELLMLQADAVAIVTDSVILSLFSLSCVLPFLRLSSSSSTIALSHTPETTDRDNRQEEIREGKCTAERHANPRQLHGCCLDTTITLSSPYPILFNLQTNRIEPCFSF